MDEVELFKLFDPLFADLRTADTFPTKRPLLAHYTSISVLEAMLRNDEVWLSNPLFMNDLEEVRFGINKGADLFLTSSEIEAACGSKTRADLLKSTFKNYYNQFATDHVLDTYVLCLTEHAKEDTDGLLSMWRAYGGNGNGAAIVFDTARVPARDEAPLIIGKVDYATTEERIDWLRQRVTQFATILASARPPDDKLYLTSSWFFQRLKLFAIFTKHRGFKEEGEWRLVYMRDRDPTQVFDTMFSYAIGATGVEPKLKLQIEHLPGYSDDNLSLSKLIERIILGPSLSSPLARLTVLKMLETLKKSSLKDRVVSSTIPFRAGG
jgi:hypothetical protein